MAAITVEGLAKRFGETHALRGLDLEVAAGSICCLLGPNGAGKTTLVRTLSTLVVPDSGRALVHGHDVVNEPKAVRRLIGLTGQFAAVDEDISGFENLYMVARLHGMNGREAKQRVGQLLAEFGLTDAASRIAKSYSGGMRRRLDLATSLLGHPDVLFLDEPTTGLDPHSRLGLWETVRRMAGDGVTVLLTTQHMEEAEALADAIVVIDHGKVIAQGTSRELRTLVGGQTLDIRVRDQADADAVQRQLCDAGLRVSCAGADELVVRAVIASDFELTLALRTVAESAAVLASIDTRVPTLDEVFLLLTTPDEAEPPVAATANGRGTT